MLSLSAFGMLLMMSSGLLSAALVVIGKILQQHGWPFFRVLTVTSGLIALCFTAAILKVRVPLPTSNQAKWLSFRGMFGAASFLTLISAVRCGATPGDAAALCSINTVVAALLGRVFLGEKLHVMHGIAVCFSMLGATLISKPSFLFANSSAQGDAKWIGYILAAASGLSQACLFISTRKSNKSSLLLLNFSASFTNMLACGLAPLTPFVDDSSLEPVARSPLFAAALFAAIFFILLLQIASSAGSCWCPAAVSATVNLGARMVSSYLAQSLLFSEVPEPLTVCGAALMFSAVVITAVARLPGKHEVPAVATESDPEVQPDPKSCDDIPNDDGNESLASFIAAEFVEYEPHEKHVRLRRPGAQDPSARQIGAALSAVVASI